MPEYGPCAPDSRFPDSQGRLPGVFLRDKRAETVTEEKTMAECMAVGIGGLIGSVCRYLIGLIPVGGRCVFPIKTFMINVAGSFLIGLITALAAGSGPANPRLVLFLKVGICGGFTTFSSFALETEGLIRQGNPGMAVLYAALSVAAGTAAAFAGEAVGR